MKFSQKMSATLGAMATVGSLFCSTAVSADTLSDALIWAYQSSPTLKINQAALRAADEEVVQARAGKRPQLDAVGSLGLSDSTTTGRNLTDSFRAQLDASLLLYDAGRTEAAIQAARANVASSRAGLTSAEQTVLLDAIVAYVDVRRDQRFVNLAENNVSVIDQQVKAARDRFDVGEVTRTDVSQADARLASARSNLASNRGAYLRSLQTYEVAVGRPASNLAPPPALPKMPATLEQAMSISNQEHPALMSARFALQAAEFDVLRAKSAKSPTVSLGANVTYGVNTQTDGTDQLNGSLNLNGSMPLLDGGTNDSLIRSAMSVLDRRKAELQNTGRTVMQNTSIAWTNLDVARASIRSSRQQIRAARIAFEGIQEEAKLGARTTLDVLDAEQEVLNAESDLASAQRDEYVAAYNLVSSMGLLTTQYLKLGIEPYNPSANYRSVTGEKLSSEGAALNRIGRRWSN